MEVERRRATQGGDGSAHPPKRVVQRPADVLLPKSRVIDKPYRAAHPACSQPLRNVLHQGRSYGIGNSVEVQ